MRGNNNIGQAQEAFDRHSGNFQAVEVRRFQTCDDSPERLPRGLFFVSAKSDHFNPAGDVKEVPAGQPDAVIHFVAVHVLYLAPANRKRLAFTLQGCR